MAKLRYEVLVKDAVKPAAQDDGTEIIALPKTGILTELTMQVRSVGDYNDDIITPMWDILDDVEVLVNGSQVIKSFNGTIMRGLEWYNNGPFTMSYDYWSEDSNAARYNSFCIYFNKSHGDTTYGLDLSKYKTPQLKFHWNCATTEADGVTYDLYASPAFTYSIIAKIYESAPAGFQGKYVKTSIIDQWVTTASTIHSTEIPLGFPLRGLIYRGTFVDINSEYTLEHVKLDFDNGLWVPIDLEYPQFWNVFKQWFPKPVVASFLLHGTDSVEWNPQVYKICSMSNSSTGAGLTQVGVTTTRKPLSTMLWRNAHSTAISTNKSSFITVTGWGPMQCLYIPMSELVDGAAETINTTAYGRIVLQCTSGSSSGTEGNQYVVAEYDIPNGQ